MRTRSTAAFGTAAVALLLAGPAVAAQPDSAPAAKAGRQVTMPGPQYEILRSGPATGTRPTRADEVSIRYVGRLTSGEIFSTSADEGRGTSDFAVRTVIPGFSALVQLMRPGDVWRFRLPAYLAYGAPGRKHLPPEPTLKRDVPPDSPLVFDVELVAVRPAR